MATTRGTQKSYRNEDFLNSPDARAIRILAEYYEPLQRFRRNQIQDTIVFFGSARLRSREESTRQRDELLASVNRLDDKTPSKELLERLRAAEQLVEMSRYYEESAELARLLSAWSISLKNKRFVICSGGGPGIMEAANKGAQQAGAQSIGLNISLPFEQDSNPYIPPDLNLEFHYFFMRKFWFVYPAKALVAFPGGFGTMDELMEVLTLVQTQKLRKTVYIVLYGSEFWKKIVNFPALAEMGLISAEDLDLFHFSDSPEEASAWLQEKLTDGYLSR